MKERIVSGIILTLLLIEMLTFAQAGIGANIDIYTQYPYPHGGQGQNEPSDPFAPQDEIILFALVTYNLAPVENTAVVFAINDPNGEIFSIRTAVTDKNGIANTNFRISRLDPKVFGTWSILGSVNVAGEVCRDTLTFEIHNRKIGDLGGGSPPQFFNFDNLVDSSDFALFMQCYKGIAPPEAMYLGDLGGGLPPQFFNFDGKVDSADLALFIRCYKGQGPDT